MVGGNLACAAPVVILDPGHGGRDPGATVSRVYEKHLCFDLANRVATHLKRAGRTVRLTRKSDQFISLGARTRYANQYKSAVFVSLHFNSSRNRSAHGLETFHSGGKRSVLLAKAIQSSMVRATRANDRGVKKCRFYVVRNTRHPAVLVEGGFISNAGERRLCCSGAYRDKLARGIADGILRGSK